MAELSREIAKVALDRAEAEQSLPIPGYTHIQRAVVSSAGMWWAGWAEAFIDDTMRATDTLKLVDSNPLGTAAGYGVNLNLDRDHTTQALGFARMQFSPIYAPVSYTHLGLVGEVKRVDLAPIQASLQAGSIPVIASLGETIGGQILNVNADFAANELVQVLQPYKIVFLTGTGGLLDADGKVIDSINLSLSLIHI